MAANLGGIPLHQFLSHTKAQRQSDGSWMCLCPIHADKKPTFHLSLGATSTVLVTCFKCGSGDSLLAQLRERGLWPITVDDAARALAARLIRQPAEEEGLAHLLETDERPPTPPTPDGYRLVKVHEYRTRQGHLLGTITRFEQAGDNPDLATKTFRPTFYFSREGVKQWLHKMPRWKPLYGLPSLNRSGPVILVEGEKTADAAMMTFPHSPVVSPMGGLQGISRTDLTPLQGFKVVIWPDADLDWEANAMAWAKRLEAIAAHIKIVQLPKRLVEAHTKWDLADPLPDYPRIVQELFNAARDYGSTGTLAFECIRTVADLREYYVAVVAGANSTDFVHFSTGYTLSAPTFDLLFHAYAQSVGTRASKYLVEGVGKDQRLFAGYEYEPQAGRAIYDILTRRRYYNRWSPTAVAPHEGEVKPFLDHLAWLLNEQDGKELLCRLANMLQFPKKRPTSIFLLQGRQGVGKNLIFNIFEKLVGRENFYACEPASVLSGYNNFFANKVMIVVNEFTDFNKAEFLEHLKSLVTEPRISIRQKYHDEVTINNFAHIFALTNLDRPINLQRDDRRFYVAQCVPQVPKEPTYYRMMFEWMEEQKEVLLDYLLKYDIGTWNPQAPPPITEAKREIIVKSQKTPLRVFSEIFELGDEGPLKHNIYREQEFYTLLRGAECKFEGNKSVLEQHLTQHHQAVIKHAKYMYYRNKKRYLKDTRFFVLHPQRYDDATRTAFEVDPLGIWTAYCAEREQQPNEPPDELI